MPATLLVPLDGSELSEQALPLAALFARRLGYRVVLLTAIEAEETSDSEERARAAFDRRTAEAEASLARAAERLREEGIEAATEVRPGPADEEIEAAALDFEASLVLMATHGRAGLGRWLRGSVADKVIRRANVPVLVLRPDRPVSGITRVAVPLDGSEMAEAAVEPGAAIARAFDADLDLVRVVDWTLTGRPEDAGFAAVQLDQEVEAAALVYVEQVRERVGDGRVHGVVLRGNAAEELTNYARQLGAGLFVMTTHGRSGFVRFALGSVADRVMAAGAAPVLLVRPHAARPVRLRRCFNCGRLAPPREVTPTDLCLRCRRHLHVCDNCVFFTGSVCLRDRPEVADTPRGQTCPEFLFRETTVQLPGAP